MVRDKCGSGVVLRCSSLRVCFECCVCRVVCAVSCCLCCVVFVVCMSCCVLCACVLYACMLRLCVHEFVTHSPDNSRTILKVQLALHATNRGL